MMVKTKASKGTKASNTCVRPISAFTGSASKKNRPTEIRNMSTAYPSAKRLRARSSKVYL